MMLLLLLLLLLTVVVAAAAAADVMVRLVSSVGELHVCNRKEKQK